MVDDLNNRLNDLIDEVYDFFTSDLLLQQAPNEAPAPFPCFDEAIGFRITSLKEFVEDIDFRNKQSACQALDEGILGGILEKMWFDLKRHAIHDEFQTTRERGEQLLTEMRNSSRLFRLTRRIAEDAIPFCPERIEFDDVHGLLFERPGIHAERIITARTIMLGPRYGITEALFHAYRNGLIPYGWDVHTYSIVCIRPSVE